MVPILSLHSREIYWLFLFANIVCAWLNSSSKHVRLSCRIRRKQLKKLIECRGTYPSKNSTRALTTAVASLDVSEENAHLQVSSNRHIKFVAINLEPNFNYWFVCEGGQSDRGLYRACEESVDDVGRRANKRVALWYVDSGANQGLGRARRTAVPVVPWVDSAAPEGRWLVGGWLLLHLRSDSEYISVCGGLEIMERSGWHDSKRFVYLFIYCLVIYFLVK